MTSPDPPAIDPTEYARLVRDATDEQLAAGMQANRELILGQVFAQMADHIDPEAARQAEAVVEWRITGREGGGQDRYQVIVRKGECEIARDGDDAPAVTYTIGPVEFIRLVTGDKSGPELFMTGKLTIDGDLMLAAMVQSWFRVPGPPASAGA
jgi:putative sterol carrier protein